MQQMNGNIVPTPSMSFGDAVKTCFKKYATFSGRARRSEFWWFYLALWVINAVLSGLLSHFASAKAAVVAEAYSNMGSLETLNSLADKESSLANINLVLMIIMGIWALATLLPTLAAMARRLHDTGKSGHLLWLFLLCGIGGLIPLIMCIGEGTPGPNQYGESPKYKPAAPNAPQV